MLSEIGLGCQSLGGGLHHGDRRQALNLIAKALDHGIIYFDTADHYSLGHSEELLGVALRPRRGQVVIATKAGTLYTRAARGVLRVRPALRTLGRPLRRFKHGFDRLRSTQRRADFSVAYLERAVEGSLKRLRTDYIDLLQLHKPPASLLSSGEIPTTIEALRRGGKVRHVGVSCETVSDALACLRITGIASVQVTINLLEQEAVTDLLPLARELRIGVIARNPRGAGLLTDRFGDITAETYSLTRDEYETLRKNARCFSFLAGRGRTLAQAAIRFVLQLPGVASTTPRALDEQELDEMSGASTLPELSRSELDEIMVARCRMTGLIRKYSYRSAGPGTHT